MKILLVDDDELLRDMYATKFSESGDAVSVAKSGEEALALIRHEPFDAVVVDMIMPGLTGPALIKEITAIQPVCIVLSNQGEAHEMEAAKAAGAVGYIIKAELIPSEVVTKVHELVS